MNVKDVPYQKIINISSPKRSIKIVTAKIACTTIALLYLIKQYTLTPGVPFGDDLPTIFHYLLRYNNSSNFSERLSIIFNNRMVEHRLLSSSLITLITYLISGKIQLPILSTIAGLVWVSMSIFYYKWLNKAKLSLFWLFPILCILLSSAPYQVILWPMAAMQHLVVIFWGYLTIYFLTEHIFLRSTKTTFGFFLLSICTAFIATFSAGNGMLIWPSGLLILVLRKEIKLSILWILSLSVAIWGYFFNLPLAGTPSNQALKTLTSHYLKELVSFFAGLGGSIRFQGYESFLDDCDQTFSLKYPSIYLGLIIVSISIGFFYKSLINKDKYALPIIGSSFFIFLTVATIVIGRTTINGDIVIFKDRYYLYSVLAICNTVFIIAKLTQSKSWHNWSLCVNITVGIIYWISWEVVSSHKIINHHNMLQVGQFNWENNHQWVIYQPTAYFENYFTYLFDEIKKQPLGYSLPSNTVEKAFKNKLWIDTYFTNLKKLKITEKYGNKKLIRLEITNDQARPIQSFNEGYAVVMASQKDTILLWSVVSPNSIRNFFRTRQTCRKGYRVEVELDPSKIPKGNYYLHQFYYCSNYCVINSKCDGIIVF